VLQQLHHGQAALTESCSCWLAASSSFDVHDAKAVLPSSTAVIRIKNTFLIYTLSIS
jgi:hypothetical protein